MRIFLAMRVKTQHLEIFKQSINPVKFLEIVIFSFLSGKKCPIIELMKGKNRYAAMVRTNLQYLLYDRGNLFEKINQDICVQKVLLIRHRQIGSLSYEARRCDFHVKPSSVRPLSSRLHSAKSEVCEQVPRLSSAASPARFLPVLQDAQPATGGRYTRATGPVYRPKDYSMLLYSYLYLFIKIRCKYTTNIRNKQIIIVFPISKCKKRHNSWK